jgi:hypothetical protein
MKSFTSTKEGQHTTAVWRNGGFSAPQTHLLLIKVSLSASTFVVKIATFAKSETVIGHFIKKQIINIYSDGIFSIGIPRA